MRFRHLVAALLAATFAVPAVPAVGKGDCSRACVERVKARERAEIKRRHARALAAEMRRYRAHPLPWCTWGPESSGPPYTVPEFSLRRYRAYNAKSGAAGKFQIIPSTWAAVGGRRYSESARDALPVIQERLARRVARYGISSQWVNC